VDHPAFLDAAISNQGDTMDRVSELIDRVGAAYRLPPERETDLRIALDEVVTNIVKYAYADDGKHDIRIRCELLDGRLATTIEDDGVAFDPLQAPMPDVSSPLATRQVGGLGIVFLMELMQSVKYERVGARNRLILVQEIT
jgi:anti-sigma regulatory factor (Ser/Thr protein kinase)